MARSEASRPEAGVALTPVPLADPARAPWRSTANSCQVPGATQLDAAAILGRARADDQVPTVRSTSISPTPARPRIRAAMYGDPRCRCPAVRTRPCGCRRDLVPSVSAYRTRLGAADGLRRAVERSGGRRRCSSPPCRRRFRQIGGDLTKAVEHRPPPNRPSPRRVRRGDHVGEQHGAQGAM
jgi:hypothetical protein